MIAAQRERIGAPLGHAPASRPGPFDLRLSRVGLGTAGLHTIDRQIARAVIARAIERGLTHLDTAEVYGYGAGESLVGEAIAPLRDRVFLTTKIDPRRASYRGTQRACEESLRRLRTDRIDLYLLHAPRGSRPLDETFAAFEELRHQGKIMAWGVSNFSAEDLGEAVRVAGPGRIACDQVLDNILAPRSAALAAACEAHGVTLVGYRPLGAGRFPAVGTPARAALDLIAHDYGVSPRAVALAWLTSHRRRTFAIPMTSNPAHVDELAEALTLTLDDESLAVLDGLAGA